MDPGRLGGEEIVERIVLRHAHPQIWLRIPSKISPILSMVSSKRILKSCRTFLWIISSN